MNASTAFLVELFHHRWSIPILAHLAGREGGRVAALAHAMGASRGGVRQAVDALVRLDLLGPNPGHGHPLRPEFVLTPVGRDLAGPARALVRRLDRWSIQNEALRKWPLPVVYGLGETGARFVEVRQRLPPITDRALSQALHLLESTALVDRMIVEARPPAVRYRPTGRGVALRPLLGKLACLT
jgi:DNA-binding HxlR family transcriptional regulator